MRLSRGLKDDGFRRAVETLLNGRVDVYDNINCRIVDVADTGTADVEFTVIHALGRIPVIYIYNISESGFVYDSNRSTWTEQQMTLKCSAGNAELKLLVM